MATAVASQPRHLPLGAGGEPRCTARFVYAPAYAVVRRHDSAFGRSLVSEEDELGECVGCNRGVDSIGRGIARMHRRGELEVLCECSISVVLKHQSFQTGSSSTLKRTWGASQL